VNAVEVVDAAIAEAIALQPRYQSDPIAALNFAVGYTAASGAWRDWPGVIEAAREGTPVAVELVCRRVELLGDAS
jgi:hypothetical protein